MNHKLKIFIATTALVIAVSFQNCGKYNFTAVSPGNGANNINNVNCDVLNPCDGGGGLQSVTQSFPYDSVPTSVDILIVDDNSGSMQAEQANLASKFSNLITNLGSLDWQIAVTSSDVCDPNSTDSICKGSSIPAARGQFLGPQGTSPTYSTSYIYNKNTANVSTKFSQTIQRNNEQGSGDERPVAAANYVVSAKDTFASTFFRPNSIFAVLILSDEDERSVGADANATGDDQYRPLEDIDQPQNLVNNVTKAFNGAKPFLVNAIDEMPNDPNMYGGKTCEQVNGYSNDWRDGRIHKMAVDLTGGIQASICQSDFSASLNNISTLIKNQATSLTLNLNYIPNSAPTVSFSPASNAVSYQWSPGTRVITLSARPVAGTTVMVSYNFDPAVQHKVMRAMVPRSLFNGIPDPASSFGE